MFFFFFIVVRTKKCSVRMANANMLKLIYFILLLGLGVWGPIIFSIRNLRV
jgi:hypothetical protein